MSNLQIPIFDPVNRFCTIANNRLNEDYNLESQLESIENWIQAWSKPTHSLHLVVINEMTYGFGTIAYKPLYSSQINGNHVDLNFTAKKMNNFDWDISKDSHRFLLCFYEKDFTEYKKALYKPSKTVRWGDESVLIKKLSDIHDSYLE